MGGSGTVTIFDYTFICLAGMMTLGVGYLYFLALLSLSAGKREKPSAGKCSFLILIPAHNEEMVISETLDSLALLEKTGEITVVVIADNCTDNTAEVARSRKVTVLERINPNDIGKGYALEWALAQFDLNEFSAVAIVDADTLVEKNMLVAMSAAFGSGAGAVQVHNEISAVDSTPLAHLQQMASAVENHLYYGGRAALGLPILLRGTGMAIRSDVLLAHPWSSHSLTEDVDYAVSLIRQGVKIMYTQASKVRSAAVSTYSQSRSQKIRWASGTFNLISDNFFPLMKDGFLLGRFELLELALSLLLMSRPALIVVSVLLIPFALLGSAELMPWFLIWPTLLATLLVIYLSLGIFFVENRAKAARSLIAAPYFGVWLIGVQVLAFVRRRKLGWTRTRRTEK